jgi:hypothetical protein
VVIEHALAANFDADLFDVELAFRDAACAAHVIAGPSKSVSRGHRRSVGDVGRTRRGREVAA